jgi:hypothetical protein
MISTATEVQAFRAAYEIATAAGYSGSKREWARLVLDADCLFSDALAGAAEAWIEYMEKEARWNRKQDQRLHVPHDGAKFKPGRRKVVTP